MSPIVPENAPFTAEQRAWLNGFLAGAFNDRLAPSAATPRSAPQTPTKGSLLVLFGSQSGSAEGLAKRVVREADRRGLSARLFAWNDYAKADLAQQSLLLVITSTWGDGDPPDNAASGWGWLNSEQAPKLSALRYAVLGLGDRNYTDFCGAAKKFDGRLAALGAQRLVACGECDVDYETAAAAWLDQFWTQATALQPPAAVDTMAVSSAHGPASVGVSPAAAAFGRGNPYLGRLRTNRRLNHAASSKDTRHLEISLLDSGMQYEVGDALGVFPTNCPVLVEELLAAARLKGDERVVTGDARELSLHEALMTCLNVTQPTRDLVAQVAKRSRDETLLRLLESDRQTDYDRWIYGRDIVDVLRASAPFEWSAQELVGLLRRLQPRLYSISSSPKAHPAEVHVTVGTVRYEAHGRMKKGVASCWLADRVIPDQTAVPVFIQASHGFRLPSSGETPVIMVGPGTGIAPFRAFLEERCALGSPGKNWLFFGDQHRAHDFLYEEQILEWQRDGFLTRLDLAFSRDQAEKLYVQHRMAEAGAELWDWLESGAHFYVCGDAKRMAKDVDGALHEVIRQHGGRSAEQAADYVQALKQTKRYQRDVY